MARGHDVRVLGHESTRDRFEGAGCSFTMWANSVEPPFIRSFMPPEQEYEWANEHIFFGTTYQDDLRPAIEEFQPDVVLVDHALRYASLEAMRTGQSLVVLCHIPYAALVEFEGDEDCLELFKEAVRRDGLPEYVSRREWIERADSVLVFSYAGFDPLYGAEAGQNVLHVGSLRTTTSNAPMMQQRYPDRPFVLVSLSTSDQNQGEVLKKISDACAELPVEALVTTGLAIEPSSLDTASNVTAIEYADHDTILPRADLLVTHAGHGTVVAALKHGVPMLCIPLGRDQPFNANRIAELGFGSVITADVSTDQIRNQITTMLDNTEAKQRSKNFASSLGNHPDIHEAVNAIENILTTRNGTSRSIT